MIVNFKKFLFILVIIFGYYFFSVEYIKLNNLNLIYQTDETIERNFKIENSKVKTDILETKDDQFKDHHTKYLENILLTKIEYRISKGDTFLSILKKFNFSDKNIFKIIDKIEKKYDLKKIKVDDIINFYTNKVNEIEKIEIYIDIDSLLEVDINEVINTKVITLEKVTYQSSKEYIINESLYADGIKNDIPQDILIKLIKLFSFDLDFQRDIKKNTVVSISYEYNQILENNNIEYKDLNYALISIGGKNIEYFKFLTSDGYLDYFNREGKNVKKSILKTPLDGARLSSNFGMRKHPISGYNKMHKGVDFAAPKGTPIYAGGNGIIEFVGNNGGYGKYIRIRHNNEYKTAYAHLSSFKKGISKGVRVNQGEIIGFVGSTGNSTGPHLHYEILFNNKHINPLKLKLPSGKILEGKELENFKKAYKRIYADHLNLLFE